MPRHELTLQAFVSSPGDVLEEREILETIVREVNLTLSHSLKIRIELLKWETHVNPGVSTDPQQVINSQIGDDYDIFIGIMWARFGTETGRFGSGTEEEFERAYSRSLKDKKSVEIMFYFKDAGVLPSEIDLEQMRRVLDFKKKLGPRGTLYSSYSKKDEFEQLLRLHLSRVVQNWTANHSLGDLSKPAEMTKTYDLVAEEPGFLDAVEISQAHLEKLPQITIRMTEAMNDLTNKITLRGEQIESLTRDRSNFDLKAIKRATNLLAEDMEAFAARMEAEIPLYSQASKIGIESWAQAANLLSDFGSDHKVEITNSLTVVRVVLPNLKKMSEISTNFAKTIATAPRATSALNRASRRTIATMERLKYEVDVSINLLSEIEKLFLSLLANYENFSG